MQWSVSEEKHPHITKGNVCLDLEEKGKKGGEKK